MEKQFVLDNFRKSLTGDYWFPVARHIATGVKLDGILHIDSTGTSAYVEFRITDTHTGKSATGGGLPALTRLFFERAVSAIYDFEGLEKFRFSLNATYRILLTIDATSGQQLEALVCVLPSANFDLEFVITNLKTGTTIRDTNLAAQTRRMVEALDLD